MEDVNIAAELYISNKQYDKALEVGTFVFLFRFEAHFCVPEIPTNWQFLILVMYITYVLNHIKSVWKHVSRFYTNSIWNIKCGYPMGKAIVVIKGARRVCTQGSGAQARQIAVT